MKELHRILFWQPFKAARNLLGLVTHMIGRIRGNVYALSDLAMKKQKGTVASGHPGYRPDLDKMYTSRGIAHYIPSQKP